MDPNPVPPPVVCLLTTKDRAQRRLEWADLGPLALTRESVAGGVASTFALADAEAVEDLARRELDCCGGWLRITTERAADHLRLVVTTDNPDGVAVIRSFVDRSDNVRGRHD